MTQTVYLDSGPEKEYLPRTALPTLEAALELGPCHTLAQNNVLASRSFYSGQGRQIGVTGAMEKKQSRLREIADSEEGWLGSRDRGAGI